MRICEPELPELGDDASFVVYADQLLLAGDPRGELIHLDHALAQRRTHELVAARKALLARHPAIVPGRARQLDWHLGFVRVLGVDDVRSLAGLLAHPSLRFVERLIVSTHRITDAELDHIAAVLPAHVISLALGVPWSAHPSQTQTLQIDALARHPLLELEVRLPVELTRALPTVRSLITSVSSERPFPTRLEHLPKLDRVMLFGDAMPIDLRPLLAAPLVDFGSVYVPIDAATIERLAAMPSLKRLRLWNAGLANLPALRSRFAHLEHLDLMDDLAP